MKQNTFNKYISRILAAILFLSVSSDIYGQEKIRETSITLIGDTSIVRNVTYNNSLIYNRKTSSSSFMMVDNGNGAIITNAVTIHIEPLYANDFEIFDDWVFFCGYTFVDEAESEKKAIVGYFPCGADPISSVNYYVVNSCREFKKLDVYKKADLTREDEVHLVLIGTSVGSRSDALADLTVFPSPANLSIWFSHDENENYDDVAVAAKYVVVSSRNKVQGIPCINFLYFKQPIYFGQDMFPYYDRFCVFNPLVQTPVFLEYTEGNKFAAIYKTDGFPWITMLTIDILDNNYRVFEIMADQSWPNIPIDIKYDPEKQLYCILARNQTEYDTIPPTQFYRVTSDDLQNNTTNGLGIKFTKDICHFLSLDRLTDGTNRFISSGCSLQIGRILWFNPLQTYSCVNKFDYPYYVCDMKGNLEKNLEYPPIRQQIVLREQEIRVVFDPLPWYCGSPTSNLNN